MAKRLLNVLAVFMVVVGVMLAFAPSRAFAAVGWQKGSDGLYYYYNSDGSLRTNDWASYNGKWYYLSPFGNVVTNGFGYYGGKTYYMGSNGQIGKGAGWVNVSRAQYYVDADGSIHIGWLSYKGGWYLFDEYGSLLTQTWISTEDTMYYLGLSGKLAISCFDQDYMGYMYFDSNGKAVKNQWVKGGSYWYYAGSDRYLLSDTTVVIDGYTCVFDRYCRCVSYTPV